MKRTVKLKVHRNFKLDPDLNARLKREAGKTAKTETAIIERALQEWFAVKRN